MRLRSAASCWSESFKTRQLKISGDGNTKLETEVLAKRISCHSVSRAWIALFNCATAWIRVICPPFSHSPTSPLNLRRAISYELHLPPSSSIHEADC